MKDYKLIIFDKDGTLCRSKSGKTFINSVDDQEFIPGVVETVAELKKQNIQIAIASNQGGVAFGHLTMKEAWEIMIDAGEGIGAGIYMFCPYHPEGTVLEFRRDTENRKPLPGMIFAIMGRLGIKGDTPVLFVGDREEDQQAAKNAGVDFMWAKDFFDLFFLTK